MRRTILRPLSRFAVFACTFAAPAVAQTTWIVDAAGSAGSDFTTVQEGVDAADPGDVVIVYAGVYTEELTVTEGITLMGFDPAGAGGRTEITESILDPHEFMNVPAGQRLVLADLDLHYARFTGCAGVVVLSDVRVRWYLRGHSNADLRISRMTPLPFAPGVVELDATTLELVDSELVSGLDLGVGGGRLAHVALPRIDGTDGFISDPHAGSQSCLGIAWATPGMHVSGYDAVITGDIESRLIGGDGTEADCSDAGLGYLIIEERAGLEAVGSDVRLGPIEVRAGFSTSGSQTAAIVSPGSTIVEPLRRDPSLTIFGTPSAGSVVWIKVYGEPGDEVTLHLGRTTARDDVVTSPVPRLTTENRSAAIGVIPANGVLRLPIPIHASLPRALTFFLQASTTSGGAERRYTNSFPIVVR